MKTQKWKRIAVIAVLGAAGPAALLAHQSNPLSTGGRNPASAENSSETKTQLIAQTRDKLKSIDIALLSGTDKERVMLLRQALASLAAPVSNHKTNAWSIIRQAQDRFAEIDYHTLNDLDRVQFLEAQLTFDELANLRSVRTFVGGEMVQRSQVITDFGSDDSSVCREAELNAWNMAMAKCTSAGYEECGGPRPSVYGNDKINGLVAAVRTKGGTVTGSIEGNTFVPNEYGVHYLNTCQIEVSVQGFGF
ncbi:MAG: hypothetical protein A2X97_09695 [Bdellovibrionales bacterium GWA1_52_35]|nr:MAG: hypothetical protein A2X97_09695 [Bdellovibrionales bacterium GWA1_52_35]HCM40429.1 hypothetical protein [Bdellovibrionales bacterium]